ncbi:hypothetical protein LPJ64_005128, partial [Coemansia asiatica]
PSELTPIMLRGKTRHLAIKQGFPTILTFNGNSLFNISGDMSHSVSAAERNVRTLFDAWRDYVFY